MAPFPSPTATWHNTTYAGLSPLRPELSAKGKTIVVTGGGTGIGAETARYFAEAGAAQIFLFGRRLEPLIENQEFIRNKFPDVVVSVTSMDISEEKGVNAAFGEVGTKIDVLVSAAAILGPLESVREVDSDAFVGSVNSNIRGALYVAQAFLRHAAPSATAIDVSSSAAHINFSGGFSAYSVSKFGVYRLWDSLAFGNPDLRIFHIQPGIVDTAMNRASGGIKMIGIEDDVSLPASFCVWLASPEANFLKGRFLWANWDIDELKAQAKQIESSEELKLTLVGWPWDAQESR